MSMPSPASGPSKDPSSLAARSESSQRDHPVDLSVIVVNRNTRDFLERCLTSIRDLPDAARHEVIVVDNASTDGSVEMVEHDFPDVILIRNSTNTGFAYPNNQGIDRSVGRYVMLLNSDTEVRPYAFDRLIRFMEANPRVGACGPSLSYPDGRMQPSCFHFHSPWRVFTVMTGLSILFSWIPAFSDPQRSFAHDRTAPAEALMGAALLVRREVVEQVGKLDEQFRIHCNEVDWCHRMKLAGWDRYFVAEAEIVHEMGGTLAAENRHFQMQGEMLQNLFDYHRKYYGRPGLLWFRFWTVIGFGLRSVYFTRRGASRGDAESVRLALLSRGIARAAWRGDAAQFGSRAER